MRDDQEFYVVFVHPDIASALRLTPQERWKIEYRAERLRRRGIELSAAAMGSIVGIRWADA